MAFFQFKKKQKKQEEEELKLHNAKDPEHVIKYLVKREMDPTAVDANGDAPIHYYIKSTRKNKFDILMTFLIHSNLDYVVDQLDNDGHTPLHLACRHNDMLSAKALVAFDANINVIDYESCTPMDIAIIRHQTQSSIQPFLQDIGGKYAKEIRDMEKEDSLDPDYEPEGFMENPHASYFDDEEEEPQEESLEKSIRNRFGLDFQLMSLRVTSIGGSSHSPLIQANYFGNTLEFHDHRKNFEEVKRPTSLHQPQLASLQEEDEPDSPDKSDNLPTPRNTDGQPPDLRTPDSSIEMALTEASVALAKGCGTVYTPDASYNSESSVVKGTAFLSPSPLSVSPASQEAIELSGEELEESSQQPTQEQLARAYSELYSTRSPGHEQGSVYTPVRNPMSMDEDSPGRKPHVHFASPPLEDEELCDPELPGYIIVSHSDFKELQRGTVDKLLEAIVSDDQDEGYPAWLQWREMMRGKSRKDQLKTLHQIEDLTDSSEHTPPPKPPTTRRPDHRQKMRLRQRQFKRQHSSGMESMSMMKSLRNPNVLVHRSILGSSVAPYLLEQEQQRGERILCLDGGGIKGLIQIEILKHIETLTGKPIIELFDWIVGSSTGAVIALGLVYGKCSLEDLKRMFFEMKDRVFKKTSKVIPTACDTDALEEILRKTMGEHVTMYSIKKPKVMIAAVEKKTTRMPLVFFNNCFQDGYDEQLVWKVARYSTAAPLYFRELDDYVDAGVVANNPCWYALNKIQKHFRENQKLEVPGGKSKPKIACILSLGCGVYPAEPIGNTGILDAVSKAKLHNIPQAVMNLLAILGSSFSKSEDVSEQVQSTCEQQGIPYFRFNPSLGESVGTAETDNEKLCDLIYGAKKMLFESGDHLSKLCSHLGCPVDY